ncbi:hypothetical protein QBC34DRAFT_412946 [Podospora aff. communis PSN243]|uniref:Apple domain-containing protein n=1 Tax=Podospora aff. communis PSN243 TaxID=3040156 RepID=A0AAV9GC99_9PEZI|nr:hypothetical protein QBC34DRAFT_412946 [Podospora aff. communis PSN243]
MIYFRFLLALLGSASLATALLRPGGIPAVGESRTLTGTVASLLFGSASSHVIGMQSLFTEITAPHANYLAAGTSYLGRSEIIDKRDNNPDGGLSPDSTHWEPECPKDNHALASINSPDLRTEYRVFLECNKDRVASDMPGMPIDTPDWYSCARACVDAYDGGMGCLSFTWRHDQVKCFLKNTVPAQSDFTEAWSGVLTIAPSSKGKSTNGSEIVIA